MKMLQLAGLVLFALLFLALPAFAQAPGTAGTSYVLSGGGIAGGLGMGLTIIGAGYGFGALAAPPWRAWPGSRRSHRVSRRP